MGRPSEFRQEVADKICAALADGESLRAICSGKNMPNKSTVFRWLANSAEFRDQYARAREAQADYWAEEILDIADDGTNDFVEKQNKDGSTFETVDHDHIARSRLRVDTRKWLMSKLAPKKYGEKLELSGDAKAPLTVNIVRHADDNAA